MDTGNCWQVHSMCGRYTIRTSGKKLAEQMVYARRAERLDVLGTLCF